MKKVYARYGGHIIKILRFLLMLTVFMVINESVGYMERLNHVWLGSRAGLCVRIPSWGVSAALAAVFVLAHLYAVSLEVFFVALAVFVLAFCLYYIFGRGTV